MQKREQPKQSDTQETERIDVIEELLLRGNTPREIGAIIRKKFEGWHADELTVRRYVATAQNRIKNQEHEAKLERNRALSRLQTLFNKTMLIQDYKTALATQKAINEIMKLQQQHADLALTKMAQEL